jgi:hypothetical protein
MVGGEIFSSGLPFNVCLPLKVFDGEFKKLLKIIFTPFQILEISHILRKILL